MRTYVPKLFTADAYCGLRFVDRSQVSERRNRNLQLTCTINNNSVTQALGSPWHDAVKSHTNILQTKEGLPSFWRRHQSALKLRRLSYIKLVSISLPCSNVAALFICYFEFFCTFLGWGETEPTWYIRRPLSDLFYQPRMIDDDECGAVGGIRIGRGNRNTRREPAPVPLCPPQIPHDLTWVQAQAAVVWSRRLIAWATHNLFLCYTFLNITNADLEKRHRVDPIHNAGNNIRRMGAVDFVIKYFLCCTNRGNILRCECSEFNFQGGQPHFWLWCSWFDSIFASKKTWFILTWNYLRHCRWNYLTG
jgi:hypothetical protein